MSHRMRLPCRVGLSLRLSVCVPCSTHANHEDGGSVAVCTELLRVARLIYPNVPNRAAAQCSSGQHVPGILAGALSKPIACGAHVAAAIVLVAPLLVHKRSPKISKSLICQRRTVTGPPANSSDQRSHLALSRLQERTAEPAVPIIRAS
jgi:hypothetical protein